MNDQKKKSYSIRISQANQSELIVILYEMFMDYLEEAESGKESRKDFREGIRKARGCVNELMNSLNFEYSPSMQLLELYVYINRNLIEADIKNTTEPFQICRKIVGSLLETYREVSRQDLSGPVMENTQAVYAGLTYGKGELVESVANHGNRGFLA